MSIVKMKRLKIIAMSADRPALFEGLMRLGTVEITEAAKNLSDRELANAAEASESAAGEVKAQIAGIEAALTVLKKYAHVKKSVFTPRPAVSLNELFNTESIKAALDAANEINDFARKIENSYTEEQRLRNRRISLAPWKNLDVPFNISSTGETAVIPCICPARVSLENLAAVLEDGAPLSEFFHISSDREHHYLLFICHKSNFDAATTIMKQAGFSRSVFKDASATASTLIDDVDEEIKNIISEREDLRKRIVFVSDRFDMLMLTQDRLSQSLAAEQMCDNLISMGDTFYMEGWASAPEADDLKKLLEKFDCWYEMADPGADDDVPILLRNKKMVAPFNMVTEMYGFPKYTNIDPNPLIAPFFAAFFGIMYGDVGYGLVLLLGGIFVTAKIKPKGVMGEIFRLMKILGVSTMLFGMAYGAFFGDSIDAIAKTFFGAPETFEFKISAGGVPVFGAIDLMAEPITALIIALCIGAFHILTGMAIKVYLLIRDGRPLAALMDVGSWWLTFAGIGLFAAGYGPVPALCGVAALLLTQGRAAKGAAGKAIGGLGSLYKIIQYMSDVLSYSRLMALALASTVIAMVFNILASIVGSPTFFGFILFFIIFIFGHAFNMGVNLISTYVHGARLQYLEYFNRFYEGGGTPFKPFSVKTRFVDIIKEE